MAALSAVLVMVAATGQQPVLQNPPATISLTISGVGPYSGTHTLNRTTADATEVNYVKKFANGYAVQVDYHRYIPNTGPVWVEAYISNDGIAHWRTNTGSASMSSPSATIPYYRSLGDFPPAPAASVGP